MAAIALKQKNHPARLRSWKPCCSTMTKDIEAAGGSSRSSPKARIRSGELTAAYEKIVGIDPFDSSSMPRSQAVPRAPRVPERHPGATRSAGF